MRDKEERGVKDTLLSFWYKQLGGDVPAIDRGKADLGTY